MPTRNEVHEVVDRLDENQLGQAMAILRDLEFSSVWERLKTIPGVKLPAHWPPRFKPVEPLKVEGEMPSEQLIRERR